jgi:hypothetical protein
MRCISLAGILNVFFSQTSELHVTPISVLSSSVLITVVNLCTSWSPTFYNIQFWGLCKSIIIQYCHGIYCCYCTRNVQAGLPACHLSSVYVLYEVWKRKVSWMDCSEITSISSNTVGEKYSTSLGKEKMWSCKYRLLIKHLLNLVWFQVLMAVSMRMTVLWDVVPCSLIEIDQRFRGTYCLHHQVDGGGSKHLWNVNQFLWDCTAQNPRRQSFSFVKFCVPLQSFMSDSGLKKKICILAILFPLNEMAVTKFYFFKNFLFWKFWFLSVCHDISVSMLIGSMQWWLVILLFTTVSSRVFGLIQCDIQWGLSIWQLLNCLKNSLF